MLQVAQVAVCSDIYIYIYIYPFKYEAQTDLFKYPVRTAL